MTTTTFLPSSMIASRWPGRQLNPINEFRDDCYRQCHRSNPTDSGWYEKTNECGRRCARELKEFQRANGKNPCAQRLQAPVFWFEDNNNNDHPIITETFVRSVSSSSSKDNNTTTTKSSSGWLDIVYLFALIVLAILILRFAWIYILHTRRVFR